MEFISPSKGALQIEAVFGDIMGFINAAAEAQYRIIVGSDSHVKDDSCFVTAIIIHQVGKGARYYYRKVRHRKITSLRQKIFYETSLSLETAGIIAAKLAENGHPELNVEIHLDIGPVGETRELIREIVGMVVGSGFDAFIKPVSCGASKVADKHTK